jgi:uncharacterized protein (DUF952 family)
MVKPAEIILHICQSKDWEAAQAAGSYSADSLESEGFIHCSRADQVADTANYIFEGMEGLVLLHIAVDKLEAEVRWEDTEEGEFPHVYGPINLDSVIDVEELATGADGAFKYPPH